MTMVATKVATIPVAGFNWYLILLEDEFNDDIRKQLDENFNALGKEVGQGSLVVRGFDPKSFRDSFAASVFLNPEIPEQWEFPTIFISNRSPALVLQDPDKKIKDAKVMFFPLEPIYREHGTLIGFFRDLVRALNNEESVEALSKLEETDIEKAWGWLSKYFTAEANFFMLQIDVNRIVKDILVKLR